MKRFEVEPLMAKLKVTVERIDGHCNMPVFVGDHFFVDDYRLQIPAGQSVCMFALQSIIPLLPLINEREALPEDHFATRLEHVMCPDPKGKVVYRVERLENDSD